MVQVENKFKDVFGRSPGAFPEDTPLEEKVDYIAKGTKTLKAMKGKDLESKMRNVAELSQKLESQKKLVAEEACQNLNRLDEQLAKDGYTFTDKGLKKLHDNKEFQEAASTLRETTAEGKNFEQDEQKKTSEASVQTDEEPSKQAVSLSMSESSTGAASILGRAATEDKNFKQRGTSEASVQTDERPSKHGSVSESSEKEELNDKEPGRAKTLSKQASVGKSPTNEQERASIRADTHLSRVGNNPSFQKAASALRETIAKGRNFEQNGQGKTPEQADGQPSRHGSMSRSPTEKKSNTEPSEKDNAPQPQENQKEGGLFSFLMRFIKKILERLLDEDEKSVENTHGMKEDAQKGALNEGMQQQSMNRSSFININGKEFNLEPGKDFNYQDKALNITCSGQLSPEECSNSPSVANAINLNINGKEYNVQPGESFNYKGPGLEVSVINGHQQSKNFDKILNQEPSISKGLKQVERSECAAGGSIAPVSTPRVDKVNTGREIS